jgi:hypothetical protein
MPLAKKDLQDIGQLIDAKNQAQTRDIYDRIAQTEKRFEQRFESVDQQLEAIKESLVFRQELHNLVRELKAQGIKLDEGKVFAI